MALRLTWNDAKATENRAKHRIGFDTAARVFLDPFALTEQDRIEEGEYRRQTIGSIEGVRVPLVARTVFDEADGTTIIHIISARPAARLERRRHEEEKRRQLRT